MGWIDRRRWIALGFLIVVLTLGQVTAIVGDVGASPGAGSSSMQISRAVGEDRTDPAPLGQAVEAGPWRLTAVEVVTGQDAADRVAWASDQNQPPADGFTYVLVNLRAENASDRALAIDGNDFGMTGSSGVVWRFAGATAPDPALGASVAPGESAEGWVVLVAAADESNLLLLYDSVTLTGNWADRVIALEDGATVADAEQPAAEVNDAGVDPGAPVGFNTAIATDDWVVEVLDVATGQAVYDLYPASDYRTTALGDVDANSLGRWIAFRVQVTNNRTGGQPASFSPTAFTLADGDGNPVPDVLTLTPPHPDAAGAYYPGGSRDGWVVFELPIDWGGTLLRFLPYQTDDDPRYFTWGEGAPQEEPERPSVPLEAGATVQTTDEVNLRSGPSTDDEIVTTLDAGTELQVTGPGEESGDYTWYPVEVTETGDTGYVAGDFLEPVEE